MRQGGRLPRAGVGLEYADIIMGYALGVLYLRAAGTEPHNDVATQRHDDGTFHASDNILVLFKSIPAAIRARRADSVA